MLPCSQRASVQNKAHTWSVSHPHIHSLSKHLRDTQTYIHTRNKAHICLQTRCFPPCPSQMFNPDSSHLNRVSWLAGSNKPLPPQLFFSKAAAARVTVVTGWPRLCSCTRASFFCSHSVTRLLSSAALYPIRVLRSHTNCRQALALHFADHVSVIVVSV